MNVGLTEEVLLGCVACLWQTLPTPLWSDLSCLHHGGVVYFPCLTLFPVPLQTPLQPLRHAGLLHPSPRLCSPGLRDFLSAASEGLGFSAGRRPFARGAGTALTSLSSSATLTPRRHLHGSKGQRTRLSSGFLSVS